MKKSTPIFECNNCGAQFAKWQGRCIECGKWNTIEEAVAASEVVSSITRADALPVQRLGSVAVNTNERFSSGIPEFDVVLGGGFVPGSLVLLGGDPGIGKSTISLQVACHMQAKKYSVLYVSAEESESQVKLRAMRLDGNAADVSVVNSGSLERILATVQKLRPQCVVLDSVQTVSSDAIPSAAGSAPQVRFVAEQFLKVAKSLNIVTILIGHVTKEGIVAGPKTLEHLVDVVLYLEGDRYGSFRVLRGVKNRFGATGEVGVFEMTTKGLMEVADPSRVFLEERHPKDAGTAVFVTLEGKRAFLGLVQALVTRSNFGYPKRAATGFDLNRLQLLVAVLTKKAGLELDDQDIYIKTVGGLKLDDPALDLPVCLAIASSFHSKPVDPALVTMGEVGLAGEIRSAQHTRDRLKEIQKMGFKKIVLAPKGELRNVKSALQLIEAEHISDAIKNALL
jgi:DNA repair protein RadA/Sms